jgi:transcriptional regulator with GAF, ATPase, and Fis domain
MRPDENSAGKKAEAGPLPEQIARLLDFLPVAIWRYDLAEPIFSTGSLEALREALSHARQGYGNRANRGNLTPAMVLDPDSLRRFVSAGFELTGIEIRHPDETGRIHFFRCSVFGVVETDRLVSIWGTMEDITAERELEKRIAVAGSPDGEEIVGGSPAIQRVREKIELVAAGNTTVLITGETGTGKELIARAIHRKSPRRERPLVTVNCGAIASGLVESELFGHEKGAFTGAHTRRIGRFEAADGGTLFLDEIGDLPPESQVKLLRVLQEGEITRVGATQAIKVDVRVIAATHRDLAAAARQGEFRQDLFYRLNVFPIRNPSLRERQDDIPLLASYFTQLYGQKLGKRIQSIPQPVLAALMAHPWPGNIRELANIIERSVIVTPGATLQLGEWVTGQYNPIRPHGLESGSRTLEELEREHIVQALERSGWKVSGPGGAAEALSLKPTTLESRMKKLGIQRPQ